MTVQFSTAVRNAMLDSIEAAMGTSAKLKVFTGAAPANCVTAEAGTLLAEWDLASDWSAAASGGVKAITVGGGLAATSVPASGTAAHYRIYDSAGTTCHEQGTVTSVAVGTGDLLIDNVAIVAGQTVNLTAFTKTAPGA